MSWQEDHLKRTPPGKFPKVWDETDPELLYGIGPRDPRMLQESLQEGDVHKDPRTSPVYRSGPELLEDTERQGFDDEYQPDPNYVDPASIDDLMRQGSRNAISRKR